MKKKHDCRVFVNSIPSGYSDYGFCQNENSGNPLIEFGKYINGKLFQGIRFFLKSKILQMGNYDIQGKGNDLCLGLKEFSNGDICVSKQFKVQQSIGLIGCGLTLMGSGNSYKYGNMINGEFQYPIIEKNGANNFVYKNEVEAKQLTEFEFNMPDETNSNKFKYDLNKAFFNEFNYNNAYGYSMGNTELKTENGLGFLEFDNGDVYIGEFKNGQRNGFGLFIYDEYTEFSEYKQGEDTSFRLKIYKDGRIHFGKDVDTASEFVMHATGEMYIWNPDSKVVVVGNDFAIKVGKYENEKFIWDKVYDFKNGSSKSISSPITNENAEEELSSLVGLENVKKQIRRIKAYILKNKDKKLNLHMAFMGNPGTGKTVVARLMGKILYDAGVLKKQTFVEASRQTLIAEYIGQTAIKTNKVLDEAMGGVLFIDEAYSLNAHSERDFGHEAIAELIKRMEDERGNFCCILAGYTKEMEEFIEMNPGFKSRIETFIEFPNYSKDELKQITKQFLKKNNLKASSKVIDEIADIVMIKADEHSFANAREVRVIIDKLQMIQAERTINQIENRSITMKDIEVYKQENNIKIEKETDEIKIALFPQKDLKKIKKDSDTFVPQAYMKNKANVLESVVAIKHNGGDSSGFIISDNGYVVTAAHATTSAKGNIVVRRRFMDRLKNEVDLNYDASVVAVDKENDVAVLKIDVKGKVPHLTLQPENAADLEPTTKIAILGYPFGVTRFDNLSITEGKVASYQKIKRNKEVINLDCSAKSGNSGSCVVDMKNGYVVGVLVGSHLSGTDVIEEINYCSPIKNVWKLLYNSIDF